MTVESVVPSAVLASMADGIGELCFASEQWVAEAGEALQRLVTARADAVANLDFRLCEVAHNAPVWVQQGPSLAWHARIHGGKVEVGTGELAADECDFKMEGDHSIISNLARLQYHGRDPVLLAAAQARLQKLSRWQVKGALPDHPVLGAVLRALHDAMASRTLPRFVFMTPEWVSCARHILSTRATSEKYAEAISDCVFTFSEEFTDTPRYAFPDGSHGGFWVRVAYGQISVGAGPLPSEFEPADALTKGEYTPVVPVGRTVNARMTDSDKQGQATYSKQAFRFDKEKGRAPVTQSSPSGAGPMPDALGRVFLPLHDELSKRTSGELPSDYVGNIKPGWARAEPFDRVEGYDASWLRYDVVDIYGESL